MVNNRAKGARIKNKTKKWLEDQGYVVESSEVNKIAYFGGRLMAIHKDLFGSDLLAMNGKDIIFIQSKVKEGQWAGIKGFEGYPFPPFVKKWVVWWEPRAKEPTIKEVK